MSEGYGLFHAYASRYDLHTPPGHYRHDHLLVQQLAAEIGPKARVLDVGCGTGILLEGLLAAGFDAHGIDAAEPMVRMARTRVASERVRVCRMQDLEDVGQYDLVVATSWSIHYVLDQPELLDVLHRMRRALTIDGRVLLQVAHAPNLTPEWAEDREAGPNGEEADIRLRYRFRAMANSRVDADYIFTCASQAEKLEETHFLACANIAVIRTELAAAGFDRVAVWDSWRRDPMGTAGAPFIFARP